MEDPCFLPKPVLTSSPLCQQGKAVPPSSEAAGEDVLLGVCCAWHSAMCTSRPPGLPQLSAHLRCPRPTPARGCAAAWKEGASSGGRALLQREAHAQFLPACLSVVFQPDFWACVYVLHPSRPQRNTRALDSSAKKQREGNPHFKWPLS